MNRGFWQGIIAGSFLGALLALFKRPQRMRADIRGINKIRRRNPRRNTGGVIKEVSRTVSGLIKRK